MLSRCITCLLALITPMLFGGSELVYRMQGERFVPYDTSQLRTFSAKARHQFKRADITFNVTYEDVDAATGAGFDDPTEGEARRTRFTEVLSYIATVLDHSGGLDILVRQSNNDPNSGTVAQAGPNFGAGNGFVEPFPLTHIVTGVDPHAEIADVEVIVNFGRNIYSGDGTPAADQADLFTVLLHEMTHGLGMVSFTDGNGNSQAAGQGFDLFSTFDRYVGTADGTAMWDSSGNTTGNANMLVGLEGGLVYRGPASQAAYGRPVPLKTPTTFQLGTSIAHWSPGVGSASMHASTYGGQVQRTYRDFEKAMIQDLGYSVVKTHDLLFPWVSNSADFESTIVINNRDSQEVTFTLTARRGDGASETSDPISLPAGGFYRATASSVFTGLGQGAGFTMVCSSSSPKLAGRWVTFDRPANSPSQGVAIRLTDGPSARKGEAVNLGYLPGNDDFQSAIVVVNTESVATDVVIYFYDLDGTLLNSVTVAGAEPWTPKIGAVIPFGAGDQYAVAYAEGGSVTGAVFVFNGTLQTAIGNATYVPGFVPPGN